MKEEIYNESQLKALEEEIRALGIPYSENEPDERYFTNFRVRLFERIDEKQAAKSIFASVLSWLSSSPLRTISIGASLAAIVIAVTMTRPVSESPIAAIQPVQKQSELPSVIVPKDKPQEMAAAIKPTKAEPKAIKTSQLAVKAPQNTVLDDAARSGDFASMDASLAGSESDDPVNLENLSESELESVIDVVRDMK